MNGEAFLVYVETAAGALRQYRLSRGWAARHIQEARHG